VSRNCVTAPGHGPFALRVTEGVAIVGHVPGPETSSGYPETEVVVRADRYGGVPPAVSNVMGEESLSIITVDQPRQVAERRLCIGHRVGQSFEVDAHEQSHSHR